MCWRAKGHMELLKEFMQASHIGYINIELLTEFRSQVA